MLDNSEIVATVQAMDLLPQTREVSEWVTFTKDLAKGFDEVKRLGLGYIYLQAKKKLETTTFDEYCREVGTSTSVANREIQFYKANEEADQLEIEMPKAMTARKLSVIKAPTITEKIEHYNEVKEEVGKEPTEKELTKPRTGSKPKEVVIHEAELIAPTITLESLIAHSKHKLTYKANGDLTKASQQSLILAIVNEAYEFPTEAHKPTVELLQASMSDLRVQTAYTLEGLEGTYKDLANEIDQLMFNLWSVEAQATLVKAL